MGAGKTGNGGKCEKEVYEGGIYIKTETKKVENTFKIMRKSIPTGREGMTL